MIDYTPSLLTGKHVNRPPESKNNRTSADQLMQHYCSAGLPWPLQLPPRSLPPPCPPLQDRGRLSQRLPRKMLQPITPIVFTSKQTLKPPAPTPPPNEKNNASPGVTPTAVTSATTTIKPTNHQGTPATNNLHLLLHRDITGGYAGAHCHIVISHGVLVQAFGDKG